MMITQFTFGFSIGLPSPPVEGLFSACALGLHHNDMQLAKLVLHELKRYENNTKFAHHVAFLYSQFCLKNVNHISNLL